jgi:hypothetical protein
MNAFMAEFREERVGWMKLSNHILALLAGLHSEIRDSHAGKISTKGCRQFKLEC